MAVLSAQWQEELNPWQDQSAPGGVQAAPELGCPGFHNLLLHDDKSLDAADTVCVCHLFQIKKAILHKRKKDLFFLLCISI